jgi:predicted membrane-bound mannosyltransferase
LAQRERTRGRSAPPTIDRATRPRGANGNVAVDGVSTTPDTAAEPLVEDVGAPVPKHTPIDAPPRAPRLTLEGGLWFFLIVTAVITRFWDLGSRALHHDETIHTYYSWGMYSGEVPYVHNPLMHGPFLFHGNALVYLLFGASDVTSRLLPALSGVLLVGLPWLLRGPRFLGHWGALAAGFMLLISPAFLYYTRYIRHDPYTAVGSLILCIAIFRYLEHPQRRWLVTAFAATAFLLTNHEIVFAIGLAFVVALWGALLWGPLRALVPVHLVFAGLGLVVLFLRRTAGWGPLPEIPWRTPTAEATNAYYRELLAHPFILSVLALGVGFVLACVWTLRRVAKADAEGSWFERKFGGAPPGSVAYGVYHAAQDRVGLFTGFIVALAIFVSLFSTLFTNFRGLATATFAPNGTLLYWLGQQEVERGAQPWFYFITEAPQYEWLAIVFGLTGVVLTGIRAFRGLRGGETGATLFFSIFLTIWFGTLFLVLSWAGEKMPWLILHFTLPAILLGGIVINEIVQRAAAWRREQQTISLERRTLPGRFAGAALVASLVLLAGGWMLLAARLTWGPYIDAAQGEYPREIAPANLDSWWLMAIAPLVAVALIVVAMRAIGVRRAAYATLTAAFIVMSLFQIHAGFRLSFLDGDIARDTLIYNTTSPDVEQLVADLGELSAITTGGNELVVAYDNCTEWPLIWYLRDFENRQKYTSDPPTEEQPAVIVGVPGDWDSSRACPDGLDTDLEGYTAQTYVLRWHEPEWAIYRDFAIAPEIPPDRSAWENDDNPHGPVAIGKSIGSSLQTLSTTEGEQRLFRLLMYRELPDGLNGYRFRVYIRNDLLPTYNQIRYEG